MTSILGTVFRISFEYAAQKMKFSMKDLLSKCDQICSFLRICSHLLKQAWMEIFSDSYVGGGRMPLKNGE